MNAKRMKIAIVGPIAPFRGGISQYTDRLYRTLKKYADVDVISFKRLYPEFMYPGSSDKEPGEAFGSEIDYIIDAYSPLSIKKAADKIIDGGYDAVLIAWWTFFWQPALAYISRRVRKKRVKTVFICHNVIDHGGNAIVRYLSKRLIGSADGYIVQSDEEAKLLKNTVSGAKVLKKLHPIYDHFPKVTKRPKKRGRLELLFFGFIRPYKGLDDFIGALELLNDKEVHVTIVGEVWGNKDKLEKYIKNRKIPNVTMDFRYVDSQKAAEYFSRADVVVLPYRFATGSGVATLAYYYGKPILGTKVGGISDVITSGKNGWLVSPNSPQELADVIRKIERDQAEKMAVYISEFCKLNNWDSMAKDTIEHIGKL